MPKLRRNQDAIIDRATRLFVDHPVEHFTMQALADACGVTLWTLRYNFDCAEQLFRAAADRLLADVAGRCPAPAAVTDQVHQTLADETQALALLLESPEYRDLLLMMLRNGHQDRWLEKAYEGKIVLRICSRIEMAVSESGRRSGTPVLLTEGAARRLFKRLETALAVAPLLPAGATPDEEDREQLLRDAAREAFEATYLFDWSVPAAA